MILKMHPYHEVQEEFASTVNLLVELQDPIVQLALQLVAQIVLSADQEWSVDQVDTEASMGAASTHIARENVNVRDRKLGGFKWGCWSMDRGL